MNNEILDLTSDYLSYLSLLVTQAWHPERSGGGVLRLRYFRSILILLRIFFLRCYCKTESPQTHQPSGEILNWSGGESCAWSGDQVTIGMKLQPQPPLPTALTKPYTFIPVRYWLRGK